MLFRSLNAFPGDFIRTSGVIGLLEASGVARWMFLVVLKICVYVPPPVLIRRKSRNVLRFSDFLYVALRFVRVSYS